MQKPEIKIKKSEAVAVAHRELEKNHKAHDVDIRVCTCDIALAWRLFDKFIVTGRDNTRRNDRWERNPRRVKKG